MMDWLVMLAAFGAGLFTAWVIGANGAASPFGPVNSAGAISVLRGSLMVGVATLLGAVTQGDAVTETVGAGLVAGEVFNPAVAAVTLVIAASLILISVLLQYPMSTVFTVVGAVLGAGLAAGGDLQIEQIRTIVVFWLIVPFIAGPLGYGTARVMRRVVTNADEHQQVINQVLFWLAAYAAYTTGANQVGLAVGPLQNIVDVSMVWLLVFGGIGMVIGAWTGSPRIIEAVAQDYSSMGPRRSIAALLSMSLLAQTATLLGVPLSSNEAVIAAIVGAGLAGEDRGIGRGKVFWTVVGWVGAVILSFAAAYGAVMLIL